MDLDYLLCGRLTKKSDVYSFGVVLLDLLCGREPLCHHLNKDQKNLVHWFKSCIQKKTIEQVIDPYLIDTLKEKTMLFSFIFNWKQKEEKCYFLHNFVLSFFFCKS